MKGFIQRACTVLLLTAAMSAAVRSQDQQQNPPSDEKPKPAAKTYGPIGAEDQDQNQSPDTMVPDNRPLTGIQQTTTGRPMERHSYWIPGVSYNNFIQSNGLAGAGGSGWSSTCGG